MSDLRGTPTAKGLMEKHLKLQILVVLVIFLTSIAILLQLVLLYTQAPVTAEIAEASPTPQPTEASIGIPVRLSIPSIAVDAAIGQVALEADGSMAVPKDPLETGWYELGRRPGETGSAIIAGHVDWYNGQTGVFADLHKVQPNDVVTVRDDTGAIFTFVVREIRSYDPAADATAIFVSTDGQAHLNLITCGGIWDKQAQQYTERLVVFADRIQNSFGP